MESNNQITIITPAEMKAIARYETDFKGFVHPFEEVEAIPVFPETYKITPKDLAQAVKNLKKKNPTVNDFGKYWVYYLNLYSLEFGFELLIKGNATPDDHLVSSFFFDLESIWIFNDDSSRINDNNFLNDLQKKIKYFLKNSNVNSTADLEKEDYINQFQDREFLENATEEELETARKYIIELIEKENITATNMLAYSCYGGNRLFTCDWELSRNCLEILLDKTGDLSYANSLGYIHYYGRCNNGVPEYKKAFEYFSIGSAGGVVESTYKLGDIFKNGYGCIKCESAAAGLYNRAYNESLKHFLNGIQNSFADAALRMGDTYYYGCGTDQDFIMAYFYYQQALCAIKLRIKENNYGDNKVAVAIKRGMRQSLKQLPGYLFREYLIDNELSTLNMLLEDDYNVEIECYIKNADIYITAKRLKKPNCDTVKPILLQKTSLKYCEKTDNITLIAINAESDICGKLIIDKAEYNISTDRIEFYLNGKIVGSIYCDEIEYFGRRNKPYGKKIHFVSVKFENNDKLYDYICDLKGIKKGSRLLAETDSGNKIVTVMEKYTEFESEVIVPLDYYKEITRFAD